MSTRRDFVKTTALASAGISTLPSWANAYRSSGSKDVLNVGLIGVGLRDQSLAKFIAAG